MLITANDGADKVNGCFDLDSSSSEIISQFIGIAKSHSVYIGKLDSQKPTDPSESSTNEEEIDSSLNIVIAPDKLDMQANMDHSRSQRKQLINAHKESCKALQDSSSLTEIAKEAIQLSKQIGVTTYVMNHLSIEGSLGA